MSLDSYRKGCKVVLLADRGFVQTETMTLVRTFGWHYRIRIKKQYLALALLPKGWSQPKSVSSQNPGESPLAGTTSKLSQKVNGMVRFNVNFRSQQCQWRVLGGCQ
ncbi:transposase [Spirulina major]|uniref:transposase n=1 Tax=Spirulina major TaxID=270636 RepID=UPI001114FA49|nr:transposase [Spirulina major]